MDQEYLIVFVKSEDRLFDECSIDSLFYIGQTMITFVNFVKCILVSGDLGFLPLIMFMYFFDYIVFLMPLLLL